MSHAHPLGLLAQQGPSLSLYILAQIAVQEAFRLLRLGRFADVAEDFEIAANAAALFARGSAEAGDAELAQQWHRVAQGRLRFAAEARSAAEFEADIASGATA
ncbi:hypothetical protein GCM10027258_79740 [Amycolatopsis stemonae]